MEEEEESAERGGGENAHGYMGCVRCSTFVCRECVGAIVSKMDELGLSDEWHNKAKIFLSKGSGGVLSWIDAERTSHCCSLKVADPFPEAKKAWFIPATGEKGRPPPLVKGRRRRTRTHGATMLHPCSMVSCFSPGTNSAYAQLLNTSTRYLSFLNAIQRSLVPCIVSSTTHSLQLICSPGDMGIQGGKSRSIPWVQFRCRVDSPFKNDCLGASSSSSAKYKLVRFYFVTFDPEEEEDHVTDLQVLVYRCGAILSGRQCLKLKNEGVDAVAVLGGRKRNSFDWWSCPDSCHSTFSHVAGGGSGGPQLPGWGQQWKDELHRMPAKAWGFFRGGEKMVC